LADAQPSPYQVALLMQDHPWSTAPVLFVRFLPFFAISGLPQQTFPQPNGTIWQAWCKIGRCPAFPVPGCTFDARSSVVHSPCAFCQVSSFLCYIRSPAADLPTAQWNYLASMVQDWQMPSLPRTRLHFCCKIIRGPQPLCFLSGFFLSLLYPVSRSRPSHSPMELFGKHGARLADAQPSPYQVALLMQDHPWSTAPVLFVRFLPFFAISGLPQQTFPQPNGTIWQAWCKIGRCPAFPVPGCTFDARSSVVHSPCAFCQVSSFLCNIRSPAADLPTAQWNYLASMVQDWQMPSLPRTRLHF
jgi:hypothetical protein